MATAQPTQDPTVRQEAKLKFLTALKLGYSVGYSAEQAGVDRSTAYMWRDVDAEFAGQWASCYERGSDWAEDKLRDRVEGGNTDATLAMLRIRRRLVPDAPPPAIQIQVLWQGAEPSGARVIEGEVRELPCLPDNQPLAPLSTTPDSGQSEA